MISDHSRRFLLVFLLLTLSGESMMIYITCTLYYVRKKQCFMSWHTVDVLIFARDLLREFREGSSCREIKSH